MTTATREKRCKVCGTDVANAKRTKDTAGNYYCEGCVQSARSGAAARTCANCGAAADGLQQLWDWQGHRVCTARRDALQHDAALRQEQQQAEDEKEQDEARADLHARRAKEKAILGVVVSLSLGVVGLTSSAFIRDGMFQWFAIGFGVLLLLIGGITGIGKYCSLTGGTIADAKADLTTGIGILLGRRQVMVERLLLIVFILLPFIVMGIAAGIRLNAFVGLGVGVVVSIVLAVVFRRYTKVKECPHCWTQGSAVFDGIEDLGTRAITTKTYETATVHECIWAHGQPVATIKTPVERTRYMRQ